MNEHESITADVKEAYANEYDSFHGFQWSKELEQVFDTWLEEVKREAQEQAWEEAIAAQHEVDLDWESYIMSNDNRTKPPKIAENPDYKALVRAIALGAKNGPYKDEQGRLDIGAIAQEILNSGFVSRVKEEALLEYADALEENRSAEDWDKEEFVEDIRQWTRDVWG